MNNKIEISLWGFVNSAFGIWLLSTIFIGGLSFCYTLWKERESINTKNRAELQHILEEGQFRMANLDTSMANASLSFIPIFKIIDSNQHFNPALIVKWIDNLIVLTATIKLGGITHIPPLPQKENYKVGDKSYSLSDIPYGQAYKFPKYHRCSRPSGRCDFFGQLGFTIILVFTICLASLPPAAKLRRSQTKNSIDPKVNCSIPKRKE